MMIDLTLIFFAVTVRPRQLLDFWLWYEHNRRRIVLLIIALKIEVVEKPSKHNP